MTPESIRDEKYILVVDDEEAIRELLHDFLTRLDYRVDTVTTGEEAVGEIRKKYYDLAVTDLFLPGMSGLDVVRELRAISPETIVIVVTAYSSLETAIESIREGAYDYITKPFNLNGLQLSVERAFEHKRLLRESKEKDIYKKLATEDGLTQLFNYTHFIELLKSEIDKSLRYRYPVSLMMIDIDNFKLYNDTMGHVAGNRVLMKIGEIFKSVVRNTDIAARYGGEEFSVFLPHTTKKQAMKLCDRLRLIVEQTAFDGEENLPGGILTISSGVAECPENTDNAEELIKKADQALYAAKRLGKNSVQLYTG